MQFLYYDRHIPMAKKNIYLLYFAHNENVRLYQVPFRIIGEGQVKKLMN